MSIRQITDLERHLQEKVQALQSQADELLHENNLIRARNERLEADLSRPLSTDASLLLSVNAAMTKQLELERGTVIAMNEQLESVRADAARYQQLRRGQHWSVIDGIGDTLRADYLDAAIDAALKAGGAA